MGSPGIVGSDDDGSKSVSRLGSKGLFMLHPALALVSMGKNSSTESRNKYEVVDTMSLLYLCRKQHIVVLYMV